MQKYTLAGTNSTIGRSEPVTISKLSINKQMYRKIAKKMGILPIAILPPKRSLPLKEKTNTTGNTSYCWMVRNYYNPIKLC